MFEQGIINEVRFKIDESKASRVLEQTYGAYTKQNWKDKDGQYCDVCDWRPNYDLREEIAFLAELTCVLGWKVSDETHFEYL